MVAAFPGLSLSLPIGGEVMKVESAAQNGQPMEVNPSVPVKTVPEFIAYARPNPARSIWPQQATGAHPMSLANCSR
jgi:hypothetical protein